MADVRAKLHIDPWDNQGQLTFADTLCLIRDGGGNLPQGTSPPGDFRWRDCEPLLEQASALLDRALSDRSAAQSVGEKLATLLLDIKRSWELNKISEQERIDLRFETPYLVSKSQCDSQSITLDRLVRQLRDDSNRSMALTAFQNNAADQSSRTGYLDYLNLSNPTGPPNNPFPQALGNYHGARVDMALAIATDLDAMERRVRGYEMLTELDAVRAQADALARGIDGVKAQQAWDDKNREYLAARADVEKELLTLKLAMAKLPWLLDFDQQMSSIRPRYLQAVRDAHDRLQCVRDGMVNVYGTLVDPLPNPTDDARVDDIIAWTRKTATWLAALTRRSHNYIFPLSVNRRSGQNWAGGLAAGQWSFNLPQIEFDQQCYVRVRGIVGWVVGGADNALWTLDVQLPDVATFVYERGATQELSQGLIKCKISAVTSREKRPNPDIVGLTSCYNASPIGNGWIVRANDAFNPGVGPRVLDDIQLDLYLSVLPL